MPASHAFVSRLAAALNSACGWRTAASTSNSAPDRVTAANAGNHFPERVENAIHGGFYGLEIAIVDGRPEHLTLGGRMFTIGFDVDAEVTVMRGINEAVMFLQPVDLRFTDRWNLTLVGVQRGETFRSRSVAANRSERVDQIFGFRPCLCVFGIPGGNTNTFGITEPKLRMIR